MSFFKKLIFKRVAIIDVTPQNNNTLRNNPMTEINLPTATSFIC